MQRAHDEPTRICITFFNHLDSVLAETRVRDGQAARVSGFPYLRVNRFLASFRAEAMNDTAFNIWVTQLQALAQQGWHVELSNLPKYKRTKLQRLIDMSSGHTLEQMVAHCSDLVRNVDLADSVQRERLRTAAQVPPEYRTWQRLAGLYFLSAIPFSWAVKNWQADTLQTFATEIAELKVAGQLVDFVPPSRPPLSQSAVAAILKRAAHNPLAIPLPDAAEKERLFSTFAPRFAIDVVTHNDRIGRPLYNTDGTLKIDTQQPRVYQHVSHTRYQGQTLLQLNYIVWFPARPRTHPLDLLGGHIDGLTWRVTLAPDGKPWLYDAMHNCGCYHLFFPTSRAKPRIYSQALEERAFIPQQAPETVSPLTLRVAHSTHYLQRVSASSMMSAPIVTYQWAEYDELRSLPRPRKGRQSLFNENGIVQGSERLERFLVWPMGIPDPGAMRQWGHHATAFIGRRHFDDTDLLEKSFILLP